MNKKMKVEHIPQNFVRSMNTELSPTELSDMYGVGKRTIRKWKQAIREEYGFDRKNLPIEDIPIEDLVVHRAKQFEAKNRREVAEKLINIKILDDKPIGIAHFGDNHIDDDGTDIAKLYAHGELVKQTKGLYGGNVGDLQNNWVGRLGRLYGEQGTSAQESWRLTEHFVGMVPWLYLVGGNHDAWSGNGDPLDWMIGRNLTVYNNHQVRLNLQFPNGKEVRINARHNFRGNSMYNTAHGITKAAMMGWRDHILCAGHTHVSGYQAIKDPMTGLISHAVQVGSYKTNDRYAKELGLDDKCIFVCPVTIIDPNYEDNDSRLITTIFDPHEGADYLTWKRNKK